MSHYRKKFDYSLHACCLMPNCVHVSLESLDQSLAKFMQGLQQSYSHFFNLPHRRGHEATGVFLFRGWQ
jgi:putative transposase